MIENKLGQQFNFKSLMRFSIPTTIMMVFMCLYQIVAGIFLSMPNLSYYRNHRPSILSAEQIHPMAVPPAPNMEDLD